MPPVPSALKLARQELNHLQYAHNNKFIPRDRLALVLSKDSVKAILQEISDTEESKLLQPNYHLDPDAMLDRILQNYIIVFAILIHLSQEEAVKRFAWCHGLTDKKLPFTAEELQIVDSTSALRDAGFLQKQYQFIPAKLKQGVNWRGDFIMPFLEDEKIGSGGFSNVYRIRVYPFYDRLQNDKFWTELLEKTGGEPHVYVRKELHRNENTEFLETFANRHLKAKHTGLIPLLAWYWHGARFNLVFPLADGDLQKFYETRPKPSNPEERLQFLVAISRLSEALAIIHNGESSEQEEGSTTRLRIQGYHRDLKPQNILFMADKTGRHHFMISDFGLTRFKQTKADVTSGLTFEFGNSTYGAPECLKNQRVTRAADVWSLGCIFAEALTFACRGKEGVQEFMVNRSDTYTPRRDLFHTGVRAGAKPEVKPEVVSWLTGLAPDGGEFTSQFVAVLTMMLSAEPTERPKIDQVVQLLHVALEEENQRLCVSFGPSSSTTTTADAEITSVAATQTTSKGQGSQRWTHWWPPYIPGISGKRTIKATNERSNSTEEATSTSLGSIAPRARSSSTPGTVPENLAMGASLFASSIAVPRREVADTSAGLGLIMATRTSSQTHAQEDQLRFRLYRDHQLGPQEGKLSRSFGDRPNNELSTTGTRPASQGSSVPRNTTPPSATIPYYHNQLSASPQLTRNPLRSLERYDTMFVVDCRGKYESPNNDSGRAYSNLARSLKCFVNAAIGHDKDGLDLAFIHEQSTHTVPIHSKLQDVNTAMRKFEEAWDGYDEGNCYELSTCLDLLLNGYQKKYGQTKVGQESIKPLNMIVLLAAPVPDDDDFVDTVIDYARDFDNDKWSKHQVGIQFVLIGDPEGFREFIHLDDVAHKENNVRDMVDATHYDPVTDEGNTGKLHKILCGGVNRKFDRVDDHSLWLNSVPNGVFSNATNRRFSLDQDYADPPSPQQLPVNEQRLSLPSNSIH